MSANYWESTQHLYWEDPTFETPSGAARLHGLNDEDRALVGKYPLPEPRLLNHFLQQQLLNLGKRLNIRQIVLATAFIFVRRFYLKVEIRKSNPYLVLATAFYLACKIEECPQHIKVVVSESRVLWADFIQPDTAKLGECEFWLISEINAQLIIHHPYRNLSDLQTELELSQDELTLAWSVVNDHYVTDLPLRYAPQVIATMAVVMTLTIRPSGGLARQAVAGSNPGSAAKLAGGAQSQSSMMTALQGKGEKMEKIKKWLSQSNTDVEALADCTQHMISLYVLLDRYGEKESRECKDQISKFLKA